MAATGLCARGAEFDEQPGKPPSQATIGLAPMALCSPENASIALGRVQSGNSARPGRARPGRLNWDTLLLVELGSTGTSPVVARGCGTNKWPPPGLAPVEPSLTNSLGVPPKPSHLRACPDGAMSSPENASIAHGRVQSGNSARPGRARPGRLNWDTLLLAGLGSTGTSPVVAGLRPNPGSQ